MFIQPNHVIATKTSCLIYEIKYKNNINVGLISLSNINRIKEYNIMNSANVSYDWQTIYNSNTFFDIILVVSLRSKIPKLNIVSETIKKTLFASI